MGEIYYAPAIIEEHDYMKHMVFLAGSIEMDTAEDWQSKISEKLMTIDDVTILNPRRKIWDNSWVQTINNPYFVEQVTWELNGIEKADTVIFYFDPKTKSPITLMELGIVSQLPSDKNVIVCCPEGFWRKGNVDILCSRMHHNNLLIIHTLDELIETAHEFIEYELVHKREL